MQYVVRRRQNGKSVEDLFADKARAVSVVSEHILMAMSDTPGLAIAECDINPDKDDMRVVLLKGEQYFMAIDAYPFKGRLH